jgi:WD40 repeat protein
LQQYAKPWHKLRAMNIYRDNDDQNLSPNLKKAVEDAMDGSEYLILLASPGAVASNWVPKELQYWLDNNPVERLLIAVVEGDVVWDTEAGDFDWHKTTCLPKVLSGHYDGEPLYLELRDIEDPSELTLSNPAFRQKVAKLVSTLRGVSLEDIRGEEIRQHRKTMRIRNAAIATLSALLAIAVGAAIYAVGQKDEAIFQRDQARMTSLANEVRAELESGSLAHAIQLARVAYEQYGDDVKGRQGLWEVAVHPTAILKVYNDIAADRVLFSPDGRRLLLAARNAYGSMDIYVRNWMEGSETIIDSVLEPRFLPDGRLHVLRPGGMGVIAGIVPGTGEVIEDSFYCVNALPAEFTWNTLGTNSNQGSVVGSVFIDLDALMDGQADHSVGDDQGWFGTSVHVCGDHLRLFDEDGRFQNALRVPGALQGEIDPGSRRIAVLMPDHVALYDINGALVAHLEGGNPVFSPDGQWVVTVSCPGLENTPRLLCPQNGQTHVWSAADGTLVEVLPGVSPQFGLDGLLTSVFPGDIVAEDLVLLNDRQGQGEQHGVTHLWSLSADDVTIHLMTLKGVMFSVSGDQNWVMTQSADEYGDAATWVWNPFGELVSELPGRPAGFSPTQPIAVTMDYRRTMLHYLPRVPTHSEILAKKFVNWSDEETDLADPCQFGGCGQAEDYMVDIDYYPGAVAVTPGARPKQSSMQLTITTTELTADGVGEEREWVDAGCYEPGRDFYRNRLLLTCGEGTLRIYDLDQPVATQTSGDYSASLVMPFERPSGAWFSPDGQTVLSSSENGTVRMWDIAAVDDGSATPDNVPFKDLQMPAHFSYPAFSDNSQVLATMEEHLGIRLFNLNGDLLAAGPSTSPGRIWSLMRFTDGGRRMLVGERYSIDRETVPEPLRGEFIRYVWGNRAAIEFRAWLTDTDLLLDEFDWIEDLPERELEELGLGD